MDNLIITSLIENNGEEYVTSGLNGVLHDAYSEEFISDFIKAFEVNKEKKIASAKPRKKKLRLQYSMNFWRTTMQTPIPVQLENWLKIVNDKRSPQNLRETAVLHLTEIRAIIDKSLGTTMKKQGQRKYENMSIR